MKQGVRPRGGAKFRVRRPHRGMPRRAREEMAGAVHHVYARGNDRRRIYKDDADRRAYLALLGAVVDRQGWRCLAYCLMDNHIHLLVETPEPNLGRGMQRLHGAYARAFNDRHGSSGHVFQGPYGSIRLRAEGHLWAAAAYIAANPVEAGACAAPERWAWSSHGHVPTTRATPGWLDTARLLDLLSAAGGTPLRRYRRAVRERCERTQA